ncbi:SynChlorMet cassette radical SAM/SPASM protein ScmE [candidate division KSB1 bacterium]|nr:SynChlorMet cassette radical SAM/SPASM protein ScmE [candidate division KSB1 bacterium]
MNIMRTPRQVDIDVTNRCNLRCKFCYHFESAGDVGRDLSTAEWLQFFEELNRLHVMSVTLAGGEPFFRSDFKELITGLVNNRMRYGILSNGTLITEETAAFLKQTGRCNFVQVSIDGSKPDIHDYIRGSGSFEKAVRGIEICKKHRLTVDIRVTLHKKNIHDVENIAELLIERLGIHGFSTNAASYMGLCAINSDALSLDTADRSVVMQKLVDLNKKYDNRITATAGPLADAHMWNRMEKARRINGENTKPGSLTGCGCVIEKIAIRADGVIVPCNMLSHIELGRINQDSLEYVWQHHPMLEKMRTRSGISLAEFEFCRGCEYIGTCTGNCPALAYTTFGEIDHPSPDACLRRFLQDGGVLPVIDESRQTME